MGLLRALPYLIFIVSGIGLMGFSAHSIAHADDKPRAATAAFDQRTAWAKVADPCAGAVRNASISFDRGTLHVAIVCNNSEVFVR